jgi:hypothetical protein
MKKIMVMLIIMVFGLSFAVQSAFGGAKQRYRWQGVAIGVGAAILGNAIVNSCNDRPPCKKVTVCTHPSQNRHGYWEIRSVWVEPKYKKVWHPGRYNSHRCWIKGRWQMIEKAHGYWQEQEVWVAGR